MTFDIDADERLYLRRGVNAPWYKARDLTDDERERFRQISEASRNAKALAESGGSRPLHPIPTPRLDPLDLMPALPANGLRALSLFSGGGGLDIGFDRAGYAHVASYDILEMTGEVLSRARPDWKVFSGAAGDVTAVSWKDYRNQVDVLHGGPPCQPFSHAGRQQGAEDARDMVPEMVRAVLEMQPRAFVLENVSGLGASKFRDYLDSTIFAPLSKTYSVQRFALEAADFGVPQRRKRLFFVGFRKQKDASRFVVPAATHALTPQGDLMQTMGAREALGLPDIGVDGLAPTIRSGLTGPRHTTSIVNSSTAARHWAELQIWPNGVAKDREAAARFPSNSGAFRLSVADCMILQGFPADWPILNGAVYRALGLIGNSVAPPMGYAVAAAVAQALSRD
ncbi:MAG: DNA (cytosine-5)-methyltransferase 1 [Brevundimonas sp.]|jgi:DNA (cytosine-5)-methyltransferase 1|uniref:DNA cytosine methyltransferase n=1 Tax=Brevundimonas sp. TaxID=1871086 RepID=UPI0039E6F7DA